MFAIEFTNPNREPLSGYTIIYNTPDYFVIDIIQKQCIKNNMVKIFLRRFDIPYI